MHPLLARHQVLLLYLTAWILSGVGLALLFVLSGLTGWSEGLGFSVPMAVVYAFISLGALYPCRAFPITDTSPIRLGVVFLIASFLSSAIWVLLGQVWSSVLGQFDSTFRLDLIYASITPALLGAGMILFLLATVIHYLLIAFETSLVSERKALELQIHAREAELKALRAQLQPHFLFNSLNSVSAMMTADPEEARTMLARMSDFLRRTLQLGKRERISLEEELSLVDQYLGIESVRLGPRLTIDRQIGKESLSLEVPPLLLQPLIENAVNHGISGLMEGGTIQIIVTTGAGHVLITIANVFDPDGSRRRGNGIGLTNVRERLYQSYGDDARLDISRDDSRFVVELRIPTGKVDRETRSR